MMLEFLDGIGRVASTGLWLPALLWTLVAVPVWGLLQMLSLRPLTQYWMRVGVLLGLPVGIAAAILLPDVARFWGDALLVSSVGSAVSGGWLDPLVVAATETQPAVSHTGFVVLGALTCGAGGGALVALSLLARDAVALACFRATHPPNATPEMQEIVDVQARALGVRRSVAVHCAADIAVPMTFGGWRPCILIPKAVATRRTALTMALMHELVHIRRFDYVVHAVVRAVRAVCIVHPLVGYIARSIPAYREQACDAAVLATTRVQRKDYAALLLKWAQHNHASQPAALGLAYSSSTLKTRISNMLASNEVPTYRPYVSFAMSVFLLVGTVGLMACSDVGIEESTESEASEPMMTEDGSAYISVETPPELEGGLEALYDVIAYPELAQQHGVAGRVVVRFIVDANGEPRDLSILSAPEPEDGVPEAARASLEEEAVDAVAKMSFTPGMQDGERVDVQMSLPVMFQLQGE